MITVTAQQAEPTRKDPRVDANFMVKMHTNGRSFVAKAADLSMAGVALVGDFRDAEEVVTLAIPLPGDREIVIRALVRRREEESLGLEFDDLDWDDIIALARYLHPRLP
jgi:hypothetical protein